MILPGIVPLQVPDDCIETFPINCGPAGVSSDETEANFKIEFPRNTTTLPLGGGAVISLGIKDLKITSSLNVANILTRNLSVLQGLNLNNRIEDLVKSRVAVNNALFDIARKDLKIVDEKASKRKAPSIYFSIYRGEEPAVLKAGIANPDMIRICEFRYLPVEAFSKILNNLLDNPNNSFGEVVGVSGRNYQALQGLASELAEKVNQSTNSTNLPDVEPPSFPAIGGGDPDVVDLILEFFPVVNLSEDNLFSQTSDPVIGGYYTILDGKVYLKLPDFSGRNLTGEANGVITTESSLWIEVLSGPRITRSEITSFKRPPLASFVGSQPTEFPVLSNLDLIFEMPEDESVKVYLSPVVTDLSISKRKGLSIFSNTVELFSVPMLTKPIQASGSRLATINENSVPSLDSAQAYVSLFDKYYPGISANFNPEKDGYPYLGQIDAHIFLGEGNRPEILLSNDGSSESKNEEKYFNLGAAGVYEILNSIRPKFYFDLPERWISANASKNADGNYQASFSFRDFQDLNLANFNGTIEFVAYVGDSEGHLTRINGPTIKLSDAIPSITSINPDGFNGSTAIIVDQSNIIEIFGEDLGHAQQVIFEGKTSGNIIIFTPGDGVMSEPSDTVITLNFVNQTLQSKGFTSGQIYGVIVQGSGTELKSDEDFIYVVSASDESRPIKGGLIAKFKPEELKSSEFGDDPIMGIPLFKNGLSATIGIKSKSKIFKGDRPVFAYLGLPNTTASRQKLMQVSFPEKIVVINTIAGEMLIPLEIEYVLGTSFFGDFTKSLTSSKKADLKFPGNSFSNYNFSFLQNIDQAYFLFTGRSLSEVVGNQLELSLAVEDHSFLSLGGGLGPAFIEPSTVLGLAGDLGSEHISSTFAGNPFDIPEEIFGTTSFTPESISTTGKINRLAVVVAGVSEKLLRNRYDIKLGSESIYNKLSKKPIEIQSGKLLFVFDNITPEIDGLLTFSVDKKEKKFGSNYTTVNYAGQATAIISITNYSIDEQTGLLSVNSPISGEMLISDTEEFLSQNGSSGIIGVSAISTNLLDALYPNSDTDGLIFDPRGTEQESKYLTFYPVGITTSTKLKMNLDAIDPTIETTFIPGIQETKIQTFNRPFLSIDSGAIFNSSSYVLNKDKTAALLFFGAQTAGLAAIKYNVPEVISIAEEDQEPVLLTTNDEISMTVGKKYTLRVKNTDRDFIVKFDEIILKPRGRPIPTENPGEYLAVVEAPVALLLKENCFTVCASTANSTRNRAKFSLGRDFVLDIDEIFQDMLLGPLKDKIPDIQGLFDKLKDAPLKFVQFLLDKANIPKDLIKSFCDLSFHILAELKISLNGFQVLMIPIQIIFCIIDVICSLLNPFKVAKAVIRLFQCLYDLILLLPMISVPVMFFQLILHLLELFKCIIDKILFTITAINEISRAINAATQKPINFTAIKALEETLSEYLFEIDADLSFLEPILSILAIFLQLLQLLFRFPCSVDPGNGQSDCGVDGSMLAGIVAGIAAPDEIIDPSVMIPIGQTYSTDNTTGSTEASFLVEPIFGNVIARDVDDTFLASMEINEDTLRSTTSGNGIIEFNATMAPTFTKSSKKGGKPTEVEFHFKSRGLSTFLNSKNVDPNQTVDTPLAFLNKDGNQLKLAANGNLYSPIDGESFLNVNGSTASVKPLILELEVPILSTDPETGAPVQSGTETITRTFDNIPKMVLMDDEFNVYFIQQNGIIFDNDGFVESIHANIVNIAAAPKLKFSKEEVELDTDDDSSTDDGTINVFDFPQLYFFDLRRAGDQIQQFCSTASINSFPFEDNNVDEIQNIVQSAQDCLTTYLSNVRNITGQMRTNQENGILPLGEIDVNLFNNFNTEVVDCLNGSLDRICRFVINSLNTSFKVVEDLNEEPLEDFVGGEISEDILDGFNEIGPAFTGAREYAAGIGDSATVGVGKTAHIEVIPRDSYDDEIIGNLTKRINLEIISDSTGDAQLIRNNEGNIFTKNGTSYFAEIMSNKVGIVKLRARICDRTIQALTFEGIDISGTSTEVNAVDCVPDNLSIITNSSPPFGALTKVDRILTIFFVKESDVSVSKGGDNANESALTNPQEFGTGLEN